MTKTDSRRYYPTALALYITYFVLGIAATIMGQYKQDFAALWGASKLADGSFDVSSVVAVIAAIVMIASSVANYLVISVAGVLTRVGGTNGPRLVLLFNMAVTLVGILLALYLNVCQKRERAAAERAEA